MASDLHADNTKTDEKQIKRMLQYCKDDDRYLILNGDTLCLMQGKYDPRSTKSALKPKHLGSDYLDRVLDDIAGLFAPYALNILQINTGNHESSVSNRIEIDILRQLVERINRLSGANVQMGQYMGYILIQAENGGVIRQTIKIAYDHGHWGGVVSKGTQAAMRYAAMFPDADIVICGHTHDAWVLPIERFEISNNLHSVQLRDILCIKTGTAKEEFLSGKGWAVEKIGIPKNLAVCQVDLSLRHDRPIEKLATLRKFVDF